MKKHLVFIDQHWARFMLVQKDSVAMRYISGTLGRIEEAEASQTMTESEISSHLQQASEYGYREVNEAEFVDEQELFRAALAQRVVESVDPDARVVPWQQLAAEHRVYFQNDPAEYLSPGLQNFLVYDKPCHLSSDLMLKFDSLAPTLQTSTRNLIFNAGLRIDGNLDAGGGSSELPLLVIVKGDLHVDNLILTGWAEVVVTGDVYVAGDILAMDGEAGGRLRVHGKLTAPRILGGMMFFIEVGGTVTGDVYWLDFDEPALLNASIVPGSLTSEQARDFENHTPLVREAYYVDSNWASGEEVQTCSFETYQTRDLIRNGKSPFR